MAGLQQTNSVTTRSLDLSNLRQTVVQLKSDLSSTKQKFDTQVRVNQNLKSDLEYLRTNSVLNSKYTEVLEQNKIIAENNAELLRQNEVLTEQQVAASLQTKNSGILSEKLSFQQEIVTLKTKLEEREETAKDYQVKVQKLEAELSSMITHQTEVEVDLQAACDKLNSLEAANEELTTENKRLEEVYQNITEERKNLETFNYNISEKNDSLQSENERLSEKAKKLEEDNSVLRKEKEQLECKNQVENRTLYEKLRVKNSQIRRLEEKLGELGRDHKKLKNSKASEQPMFRQEQVGSESKDLDVAKASIYELNAQLDSLKRQLADHQAESERKSISIDAMGKLLTATQNKEQRTNAAVKMLRLQVDSLNKEKDDLNRQLKSNRELEIVNGKLKVQPEDNAKLIAALKEQIRQQQFFVGFSKIDPAKQEAYVNKLEHEAKQMVAKVNELEEHVMNQEEKVKHLQNQLDSRELDISNLAWQFEQERNRLISKVDPGQSQILKKKEEEIAAANETIKELEESLKTYNSKARTLTERLIREKATLQTKLRHFQAKGLPEKKAELEQSLETESPKLKVANEAIDNLRSEIRSLEKELKEKLEVIREQGEQLSGKEMDLTYVSMELTALKSEYKRLQTATPKRHSGEGGDEMPHKKVRCENGGGTDDKEYS